MLSPRVSPKEKKDKFDNKANSINFGMQEASTFGMKGPADYIAVFDADVSLILSPLVILATLSDLLPAFNR